LARTLPRSTPSIYLPSPTWANHNQIFTNVGLSTLYYPYYSPTTKLLDFEGMLSTLRQAPQQSIVLLHACAHNPTGVDPTEDQWKDIAQVIYGNSLIPFFDCAYQGFASGSLSRDNFAIRHFTDLGIDMLIAQSFSKNLGLYGQRVGCLHVVVAPEVAATDAIKRIASQLSLLQRSEISNPPIYGAQIASTVLNSTSLFEEWQVDLRKMADRIMQMRKSLKDELDHLQTPGQWGCLVRQIGMFAYTGLNKAQVLELRHKWHVYMTEDGRISVAGLNTRNVKFCAQAIDDVVRRVS
jgi:aspartate aminotransferase